MSRGKKTSRTTKKLTAKGIAKLQADCAFWKEASLKLAKCVILTIRTDGKLGMGSGLLVGGPKGCRVVERWDKDFIEALHFIGIAVVDKPKKKPQRRSPVTSVDA